MAIWIEGWHSRWILDAARVAPHVVSVLLEPPVTEPFTLAEAKLRAGLSWPAGDPRDPLMEDFIRAARAKVELDTGLAFFEQTRGVYLDAIPPDGIIRLPAQSMPLIDVLSVEWTDPANVRTAIDPAAYVVDYASGRIALAAGATWPANLRAFQPWLITLIAGWPDVATLKQEAPLLYQAAGLLVAHYATIGRDLAITGTIVAENVEGYADTIQPFRPVTVI